MRPIQRMIEDLLAKEQCPRLHIDVTHEAAVCPDFVVEKWQQQLVIDLDPSYPLDLAFTEVGVEADLSFGGYVTRCVFPWAAIYVVADRATGRGKVFERNVPGPLRQKFGVSTLDPKLTEVRDDERAKGGSRRRKRRRAKPGPRPVVAPVEAQAEAEGEGGGEGEAEAEPKTDEQAPTSRRAAFKVIDGGG